MRGTIAIEEAVVDPKYLNNNAKYKDLLSVYSIYGSSLPQKLLDIHGRRLQLMDAHGVEYMVLSITSPGPQDVVDREAAEQMAVDNNNYLAAEVRKNPKRFGAFAALSMHDATQAAVELRRAVTELGMVGALVNDWQSTLDSDGQERKLYYDTEDYDPFWAVVQELDVPIYFHPRYPLPDRIQEPWLSRIHLMGASVGFGLDLSFHIYALCSSGVFDRFPNIKIIIGHFGEKQETPAIPLNLWRSSYQYNFMIGTFARKSKHDYAHYWQRNVYITTSGSFNTEGLRYCVKELGAERCLYSIDHPYSDISQAQDWWNTVDLPPEQKEAIGRRNAIRLLKLPLDL